MSNRTIWHVMKTYDEKGVYYQTIPYDIRIIYEHLKMKSGIRQVIKFLWNSRWTKKRAYKLAARMNMIHLNKAD